MIGTHTIIAYLLMISFLASINGQQTVVTGIRVVAQQKERNTFWCFECDTTKHGDECANVAADNRTLQKMCNANVKTCTVERRFYSTSEEDIILSIERRCTRECKPGCMTIDKHTNFSICTSCCEKSNCNTDNATASASARNGIGVFLHLLLLQITSTIIKLNCLT